MSNKIYKYTFLAFFIFFSYLFIVYLVIKTFFQSYNINAIITKVTFLILCFIEKII